MKWNKVKKMLNHRTTLQNKTVNMGKVRECARKEQKLLYPLDKVSARSSRRECFGNRVECVCKLT